MSETAIKLGGGRATRLVKTDKPETRKMFERDEDETTRGEVLAAEVHVRAVALNEAIFDASCAEQLSEFYPAVVERRDALNEAVSEAERAGLRVEVKTERTPIYDSPYTFPFQHVQVWRGDELLSSVHLPKPKEGGDV